MTYRATHCRYCGWPLAGDVGCDCFEAELTRRRALRAILRDD